MSIKKIRKITLIGLFVNLFLSFIKFIFGVLGHSQAVIADAVHSLTDLSTDIIVFYASKFWLKPADEGHPYGHKRIEVIVTASIGLFLILAGLGLGYNSLIGVRGVGLRKPGMIALSGALISILVKEILYRVTLKVGKRERSQALIANAWHHRTDALSSLPVALAVGLSMVSQEWAFLDKLAAFIVSLFILYSAGKIVKPVILEILGTAAPESLREDITRITLQTEGVKSIHALRTRKMGGDWYVDLHIQVNSQITVKQGHNISKEVKRSLLKKNQNVIDVLVHLEPYG